MGIERQDFTSKILSCSIMVSRHKIIYLVTSRHHMDFSIAFFEITENHDRFLFITYLYLYL